VYTTAAVPNGAHTPDSCGGGAGSHICEQVVGRIILNATGLSLTSAQARLAKLKAFVLAQPHADLTPPAAQTKPAGPTSTGALSRTTSSAQVKTTTAAGDSSSSIAVPTIVGCFVLPDGTADAEVTFPATTPPLQVFVLFTDVTAGQRLTSGDAENEDGRYDAAP
jgi:hypothetical protein